MGMVCVNVGARLQCIPDTIMGHSNETQLSESSHVETLLRNQCNHGSNAGSSSAALLSALYIDSCLLRGCSHQTRLFLVNYTRHFSNLSFHWGTSDFILCIYVYISFMYFWGALDFMFLICFILFLFIIIKN